MIQRAGLATSLAMALVSCGGELSAPASPARLVFVHEPPVGAQDRIAFSGAVVLQLVDANNAPVAIGGITVTASDAVAGRVLRGTLTATSSSAGIVTFGDLAMAGQAGTRTVAFSSPGLLGATADVVVSAGAPASLTTSATSQKVPVSSVVPPVTIAVTDSDANPVSGVAVQYALGSGGGSIVGTSATTNTAGVATVGAWTTGPSLGANTLTASIAGAPGLTTTLTATGVAVTPDIASGGGHTCVIDPKGGTFCWGNSNYNYLGDGTTGVALSPVRVATNVYFAKIAAGVYHTCALDYDGQAFCWGDNFFGEFGDQAAPYVVVTPIPIPTPLRFQSIFAGDATTCAITAAGAAYCWGDIALSWPYTTGDVQVPTPVSGNLVFKSISIGLTQMCGLTTSGQGYCWGPPVPGGTSLTPYPVTVAGGATLSGLGAGVYVDCAITSAATPYCWGQGYGSTPVPVASTGVFSNITTNTSACALDASGAAWCWGPNTNGEVGDGTRTARLTAVPVSTAATFVRIATGGTHTCAMTASGAVYCWGYNNDGGVGDGTGSGPRLVPVQVAFPP